MSVAETRVPASIWHDVECGAYSADLALWSQLAAEAAGPVLELGAGTGRVALRLASEGHEVTAVDLDPALLAALGERARAIGVAVETHAADVRELALGRRFALVAAPMQLAHLFDASGRRRMLKRARAALCPGGSAALAILAGDAAPVSPSSPPLPDVRELDGWVYSSLPIEVSERDGALEVRRLRQAVSPAGELTEELDSVRLERLTPETLESEALAAGLVPSARIEIPPTDDHVGSTVIVAGAP